MSLGNAEEAIMDGQIKREVEVERAGGSAERGLQAARAERDVLF